MKFLLIAAAPVALGIAFLVAMRGPHTSRATTFLLGGCAVAMFASVVFVAAFLVSFRPVPCSPACKANELLGFDAGQLLTALGVLLLAVAGALVLIAVVLVAPRLRRTSRPRSSDSPSPGANLMRWVWAVSGLMFSVVFGGVTLYQQIHVILDQPSCMFDFCVMVVTTRGFALAAALLAATESWLVGRLLLLIFRSRRALRRT
jgi:hypothetical protein